MRTYTIVKELLPMIEEKVDKFAKKYKIDYTFEKSEPYLCKDKDSNRFGCTLVDVTINAEYKVNKPESEFIGKVGEKITFSATPTVVYSDETDYGWVFIYKMLINDKDVVIWKTSKDLDTEKELQFTATIKALDEYRGEKQTVITRAKTQALFAQE